MLQRMVLTWAAVAATAGTLAAQTRIDPFAAASRPDAPRPTGVIASVEFVDAPINTVFKMISDLTGWSIILSPEVSKQPPRINLWIRNLTPNEVLDQVSAMTGLAVQRNGSVIQVLTFDEYAQIAGLEKRVVRLQHASARDVATLARPFCDKADQSRLVADETAGRIVLLMPKARLESVEALIRTLDVPFEPEALRVVQLKALDAAKIAPALEQFLTRGSSSATAAPRRLAATQEADAAPQPSRWNVQFMVEPSLNAVVLRGAPGDLTKVADLIAQLDVSPDVRFACYELKCANARDAFATVTAALGQGDAAARAEPRVRLALSEAGNRILVEGGARDHERIARLLEAIDKPLPAGTGSSRVYRLENASSTEAAKVLDGLLSDAAPASPTKTRPGLKPYEPIRAMTPTPTASPAALPAPTPAPTAETPPLETTAPRVIDSPEINAVIVRASSAEHEEVARILKELDKPRSQVLLEVTLVTVRSDTTFDLGLELQGGRLNGSGPKALGFSTFGVGSASAKDGTLRVADPPSFGANLAVFDSHDYALLLHALKTVGEIRITSAPKVLAQDNSKAQINSINQEPYESLSQSQTTTLSSFGGFVDAGTRLTVVPHISEQNWLRLEYEIDDSSFGTRTAAQESANLPPPRRQSFVNGTVRIPAEHMIVLGGIVGARADKSDNHVLLLGDIPGLGELFRRRSDTTMHETLFVFIRPRVLRDAAFRDLLYLSRKDLSRAKLDAADGPRNGPKLTFSEAQEAR